MVKNAKKNIKKWSGWELHPNRFEPTNFHYRAASRGTNLSIPYVTGTGPSRIPIAGSADCTTAQWCLSCVHAQMRNSCKEVRNNLADRPAFMWRSGVPSWKGRGPSAVDSTPPGAVLKYPDPSQQGNDLSRSRGDWIRSGAGLFPSGFPSPPTTCLNFSLWRDLSVWRIWGGYLGHRRSVWEGFIDSGDAVPVAV